LLTVAAILLACSCDPTPDGPGGASGLVPPKGLPRPVAVLLTPEQMLNQNVYSHENISTHARRVKLTGEPFAEALRIVLNDVPENFWDIQTIVPNGSPIVEGDVLLAEFYVRAVTTDDSTGRVLLSAYFQDAGPPWNKGLFHTTSADRQWRRLCLPFRAKRDYAPGKAVFCFGLGYTRQTLELAGVRLVNYGPEVALKDLPATDALLAP